MRFLFLLLVISNLQAANYYVTIAGLGGEPEYETQFAHWAADLDHQLHLNGPDAHIETLSGAAATRVHVREVLNQIANQISADDAFGLFLIGHGTFDGAEYKFNVPGPDISAGDLRDWLSHLKSTRQLVVNMTSSSGASLATLSVGKRIVMTATKSGNEKNATVFPRFFIDALKDPAADTDKDGTVSALEAFHYAQQKVTSYFVSEKLIASEHSLSSGDQQTFALLRPPSDLAKDTSNPAKQKLISHKDNLEAQIDRLKYQKASLPEPQYKQQLTSLLLDLARTQAEIDK